MPEIPAEQTGVPKRRKSEKVGCGVQVYKSGTRTVDQKRPEDAKLEPSYNDPVRAFITDVEKEIANGYGFVPFIGAGFSVTAGIPMIRHLLIYLQRCICMMLGIDITAEVPETLSSEDAETWKEWGTTLVAGIGNTPRWNPRTDSWPPFIDRSRATSDEHWTKLVRLVCDHAPKPTDGTKPYWIYEHAHGAMQEWRTALEFLTHFQLADPNRRTAAPTISGPLEFCEPDRGIVDSCFRQVMRNKRPSTNHHMLAALSSLLGIDLILTTNFDNLTEIAFSENRSPLTAFDVHLGETLPDMNTVSRSRSIIKLHGSLRSLRADFSLEALPTDEDKRTFRNYLAEHQEPSPSVGEPAKSVQRKAARHLLMLGVAAREKRTVAFIQDALSNSEDLKVYWICYSETEVATVRKRFRLVKHLKMPGNKSLPRVNVLPHTNAGLMLLHLYQTIRKSLPVNRAIFPSTTRLAIPPLPWGEKRFEKQPGYSRFLSRLRQEITGNKHSIVLASARTEVYGVDSAAAEVFRELDTRKNCLWLDMNDIHDADELFEAFREAAFHKLNEDDWTPLFQTEKQSVGKRPPNVKEFHGLNDDNQKKPSPSPLTKEIARIINSSNQPWVLFLDARETPGSNRTPNHSRIGPNGWMDVPSEFEDQLNPKRNSAQAFCNLMKAFVEVNKDSKSNDIVVVLLCYSMDDKDSYLVETLKKTELQPTATCSMNKPYKLVRCTITNESTLNTREVVEKVISWASGRSDSVVVTDGECAARRHFIQTLISMQRPRHLSVAWSKCVNDKWQLTSEFDKDRLQWLKKLEEFHLLRRMDGGFLWCKTSIRQALRDVLALRPEQLTKSDDLEVKRLIGDPSRKPDIIHCLTDWKAPGHLAAVHLSISTWYRKVLDATGEAVAVFEIVDHLCWSAEALILYSNLAANGKPFDPEKQSGDLAAFEKKSASLAAERINTARELLTEHDFLIRAQGHPGATLRRLECIRDFWVRDSDPEYAHQETLRDIIRKKAGLGDNQVEELKKGKKLTKSPDGAPLSLVWMELLRCIAKLQCTADEVARVINYEIAEDGDAFAMHREAGLRMVRDIPLTRNEVQEQLEQARPPFYIHKEIKRVLKKQTSISKSMKTRQYEWIRWWTWCAQLGNVSRSFDPANISVQRAVSASALPLNKALGNRSIAKLESLIPRTDEEEQGDKRTFTSLAASVVEDSLKNQPEAQLEALHALEVATFNLTLRAHTQRRALALDVSLVKTSKFQDSKELDGAAFKCATKGIELVERIQNTGEPLVAHDFDLHVLKARLFMLAAIASLSKAYEKHDESKADKEKEKRSDGGRDAMTFLGDAAACLNFTSPELGRAELAFVELRRAEVRLHEAASRLIDLPDASPLNFEALTYAFLTADKIELDKVRLPIVPSNISGNGGRRVRIDPEALRFIRARARDALRFLDRAEPILRERRRNVFWSTWYFERRLRAISLLLWVSVFDCDPYAAIPYLGLEAAMDKTPTEPDRLLEDAIRMIRVDAYRMSMVVLSYASCTRALEVRILQANGAQAHLKTRLDDMHKYLQDGLYGIKAARKARRAYNRPDLGWKKSTRKQAAIDSIAEEVIVASLEKIRACMKAPPKTSSHG